jgi:hypothetical protein
MKNERTSIWKMVRALNDRESNGGFWLPNIQRPFVWSEAQIEKLFDSIMREYPISTLLVWRTKATIKHRKFIDHWKDSIRISDAFVTENSDAKGLVLDGQQRLQSLIIGLTGSYNGRVLCLDVCSGTAASPEDIRYRFRFMELGEHAWPWVPFGNLVRNLAKGRKLASEVANELLASMPTPSPELRAQAERTVGRAQFEFIADENLSYQLLDSVDDPEAYTTDDVVEIFIRANAGGTRLGKSDLMFSLLASEWTEADEELEELLGELNKTGYAFDRDFVLKACLVMLGHGAKYAVTKFRDSAIREQFVAKWPQLSGAIRSVRDFLHGRTFLRSDKAVPSYLALIPLIYFRYKYPQKWESANGREDYILRTMLTGAFGGTPDNMIDRSTKAIDKVGGFSLPHLFQVIRADGRSLEVTPETILGTRYGKPQSHLIFNIWYQDFDYQPALEDNLPQQDHLFPQSLLRQQKETNPGTGRVRQRYGVEERDQLGNLALLTARENGFQGKCDTPLNEWLPDQLKKDPAFLVRHLIPSDPALWKVEQFSEFIEARKKLILDRFASYLQEPAIAEEAPLNDQVGEDDAPIDDAPRVRGERELTYFRFWDRLIERSKSRTQLFANRRPSYGNWLAAPSGRSGFGLNLSLTEDRARVELFIRVAKGHDGPNKAAFKYLEARQEEIDRAFGEPLDWQKLPDRLGCRICKDLPGGWLTPEPQWPELHDRMIDALVRLERAMHGPLREVPVERLQPAGVPA